MSWNKYQELIKGADEQWLDTREMTRQLIEVKWYQIEWFSDVKKNISEDIVSQQSERQSKIQKNVWLIKKIWQGAWLLLWWTVWAWVAWSALKWLWKLAYWMNLPPDVGEARAVQKYEAWVSNYKPRTVVETGIESPLLQKWTVRSPSTVFWQFWTREQIWKQAIKKADNIFKDIMNPVMDQADELWLSFKYTDLKKQVIAWIKDSWKRSVEQKKNIIEDVAGLFEDLKGKTSLRNLDKLKSEIANKLPKKHYDAWWPITQTLQEARWEVASVFRETIHDTISKKFWVDSAKQYQNWANLKKLWEVWVKSMTKWQLKWWSWNFITFIMDTLATPITTTAGKASYKIGEALQYIPKQLLTGTKAVGKLVAWWKALVADPLWLSQLLEYVPWTIGESFEKFNETNPWSIAFKALFELWASKEDVIKTVMEDLNIDEETATKVVDWELLII